MSVKRNNNNNNNCKEYLDEKINVDINKRMNDKNNNNKSVFSEINSKNLEPSINESASIGATNSLISDSTNHCQHSSTSSIESSVDIPGMRKTDSKLFINDHNNKDGLLHFHDCMTLGEFVNEEHLYSKPYHLKEHKKRKSLDSTKVFVTGKKNKKLRHKDKKSKDKMNSDKRSKDKKKKKLKQSQSLNNSEMMLKNSMEMSNDISKSSFSMKNEMNLDDEPNCSVNENSNSIPNLFKNDVSVKNEIDDSDTNNRTSISSSGRAQRIRKKPKRWDNDEVEVDFSGKLNIISYQDDSKIKKEDVDEVPSKKRKITAVKKENESFSKEKVEKESNSSSDEESSEDQDESNQADSDDDSNFGSDDDPEKLWCICRQPYDDRFMIGCDACEEWFHGKCVNVTKVQGRKMEKLKQEWFCPTCSEGLINGHSRKELKLQAAERTKQIEEKEKAARLVAKKKREKSKANKEKNKESSSSKNVTKVSRRTSESEDSSHKIKKIISKEQTRNNSKVEKEEEEKRKLKKLIKASKKDLNEKKEKLFKNKENPTSINCEQSSMDIDKDHSIDIDVSNSSSSSIFNNMSSNTDEFSKVVVINKVKNESLKKKHKSDLIDQSVQDLFKAEPVLMRSLSSSSTSSTISTQQQSQQSSQRKSSNSIELRRSSSSSFTAQHNEIICPSGCGKNIPIKSMDPLMSIYCNNECIQTHVNETLKALKQLKHLKDKANQQQSSKPIKIILMDKINNVYRDNIAEKDVLYFIMANPTYEIHKPSALRKMNDTTNISNKSSSNQHSTPIKSPQLNKSFNETKKVPSSPVKMERSPSISDKNDDNSRRKFVRNSINEILNTRFNEMSPDGKSSISPSDISKLSSKIEDELFKIFKHTNLKYNNKSRSLIFNLKDSKNTLYRKVLLGVITPERLVNMSAEELASLELARWREHEKKTMIQLITRDAVDQANQVIVKKTHKGEEFIESDLIPELQTSFLAPVNQTSVLNESNQTSNDSINLQESSNKDSSSLANDSVNAPTIVVNILDTTAQHKTHVFSNNCKICIRSLEEQKHTEKDVTSASTSSIGVPSSPNKIKEKDPDTQTSRPQPKRVRIEPESTQKFLKEASVKFSDQLRLGNHSPSITAINNNESLSPSSGTSIGTSKNSSKTQKDPGSHESKSSESNGKTNENAKYVWKGTIFMPDVAKFVATAFTISGNLTTNLSKEISEHVNVCGRITPEQVLGYVTKLKTTKRADIGLVKFLWVSREERTGYDAFFHYLHSRGRYGVVQCTGRMFKDFYILPLPKDSEVPKVLLPTEGGNLNLSTGMEKHNHRPDLLLGIFIKNRKSPSTSTPSNNSPAAIPQPSIPQNEIPMANERSYTPPPPTTASTPPSNSHDDGSYTPPPVHSKKSTSKHDSNKLSPKLTQTNQEETDNKLSDLLKQVASSSNPIEMTPSILNAISGPQNLKLKEKLLCQFGEKVANQIQSTIQKRETEEFMPQANINSPTNMSNIATSSAVSFDNVFSNIKNIQIPDNLKDILKTVQEKTAQVVDAQRMIGNSQPFIASAETKDNIHLSTGGALNDPRLMRSSKHQQQQQLASDSNQPVASMSEGELIRKAQEQLKALAQMGDNAVASPIVTYPQHQTQHHSTNVTMNSTSDQSSSGLNNRKTISFQWKKKK